MEIQKQHKEKTLAGSLELAIIQGGAIDVKRLDKVGLNLQLKKFKNENGSVNFAALLALPSEHKIGTIAKRDLGEAIKVITVGLTMAFETMNLARPMQAFQVLDLAEMIVDEAPTDSLAVEDLMIFLQKLTRGHYPGLYEGMDIPKFMERFNQFRDERFNEWKRIRDEKHEEYKNLGDDNYYERNNRVSPLGEEALKFREKLQAQKDELYAQKAENKRMREQNKF
jgi:hypothetical protein